MRLLTTITMALALLASNASAFDPDDLQKLKDTGSCSRCDLSGADMWWANLEDADLGGANLMGASLRKVYMNGAILCNKTMPGGSIIYSGC